MARPQLKKFPRLKFTAYDAGGNALGDVVAKSAEDALPRAVATYGEEAVTVEQTPYVDAPAQ